MTRHLLRLAAVLAGLALAGALLFFAYQRYGGAPPANGAGADAVREIWTCPMHPEVQEHAPGKCPKCGMDLVKANAAPADESAAAPAGASGNVPRAAVQLDTRRRQLAGVRTAVAERTTLTRTLRAVGLVRYDETRLTDVNLKLDGWAKKLHADFTGQFIRRGQPLVDIYSPDLFATENEYLLALSTRDSLAQSQVSDAREQAERLVDAARQRLLLWDLPDETIRQLERSRRADATVTFPSPVTGFVIEKPVVQGMRVTPGQTLYKVADLSTVWVEAEFYESDAPFVRTGAPAVVTLDAFPGERLAGRSIYVYPFVEEKTRTVRVRFAFPNPRQHLKPGMFANVEMSSSLGAGVTVPADAVLDAGRTQMVFVSEGDGYFEPRPVTAGLRADGHVQILEGIAAGETVATGAAFFLDSESQLRAAAGDWSAQPAEDAASRTAGGATIEIETDPNPPRSGENRVRVRVLDQSRGVVADANVSVVFYMAAMPSMNMPAMRAEARLVPERDGQYGGTVSLPMAGRWDVTVAATRAGTRFATKQTTVVAR